MPSNLVISATAPETPIEGQIWLNSTSKERFIWNGVEWVPIGKLTGDVSIPSGGGSAFIPTQTNIYPPVSNILEAGTNITLDEDATNKTITINSTGGGTDFTPTQDNLYSAVADIIESGTNVSLTEDSTNKTITINSTASGGGGLTQLQSDWNQSDTSAVDFIKNKPTIPAAQIQSDWTQTDGSELDFIKNKPTIPAAQIQSDWTETDSGELDFIKNKPTIPAAQIQTDWTQTDTAALDFLKNKPDYFPAPPENIGAFQLWDGLLKDLRPGTPATGWKDHVDTNTTFKVKLYTTPQTLATLRTDASTFVDSLTNPTANQFLYVVASTSLKPECIALNIVFDDSVEVDVPISQIQYDGLSTDGTLSFYHLLAPLLANVASVKTYDITSCDYAHTTTFTGKLGSPTIDQLKDTFTETDDIADQALKENTQSVAGKGRTTAFNYWSSSTTDENAKWRAPHSTIRDSGSTDKGLCTETSIRNAINDSVPPNLIASFAAQDGDVYPSTDLGSGSIGFYESDGTTQYQNGDVAGAKVFYIAKNNATYGEDPTSPGTTLDSVNLEKSVALLLEGKPHLNVLFAISQYGTNNVIWYWSNSVSTYGTQGWRFNLTYIKGSHTPGSYGVGWNVVMAMSVQSSWRDLIDNDELVRSDGSNVTEELKSAIQGDNEEVDLPNTFRVNATNVARYAQFSVSGSLKVCSIRIPNTDTTNDSDLKRLLHPASWVEFTQGSNLFRVAVTTNATRATIGTSITFTFNYDVLAGTTPTGSANWNISVVGEDVHRGELLPQVFEEETPSIGGKGGSAGDYWQRKSGNDNATWESPVSTIRATGSTDNTLATETAVRAAIDASGGDNLNKEDTVPFAAAFRDVFTRTFVLSVSSAVGEALVSSNNNVPSGAPSGTTDFIGLDKVNSNSVDQSTELDNIAVGDWIRAKISDKYIIAKIQHIEYVSADDFYQFWFNPSTDIADTLSYDQLGTGSGEIRFYTKSSGSGGINVQEEGTALSTAATTLNFVGGGVVASGSGATKTITVDAKYLNKFDSGTLTETTDVTVSDTDAIPGTAITFDGVLETENITNFGTVYKTLSSNIDYMKFEYNYDSSLGVAIRLRYSDTKPTGSVDAKNYGTQLQQVNDGAPSEYELNNPPANRYYFFTLSGGGSRTIIDRSLRILMYAPSLEGDITDISAGDGLTGGGSAGDVSIAVNPGDGIEIVSDAVEVKLDGTTLSKSSSGLALNVSDATFGDKAFSNPPSDLSDVEKTAVRTAIGAGTGGGGNPGDSTVTVGTLYMVTSGADYLSTVDTITGAATRIGSATKFGVNEGDPRDLAAIGNTLYMVGSSNECLYTLNTTTGGATRVGSANRFGINEDNPSGIAAIGNTLYMVGFTTEYLCTLNTTTGVSTRIGNSTRFGVNEQSPSGLAAIGNTLYMLGWSNDCLYTVNTTTGIATRVGSATQFGISESDPTGLAAIGNTLYMVGQDTDYLSIVNTTTGVATRVGNSTNFGINIVQPFGLAAITTEYNLSQLLSSLI